MKVAADVDAIVNRPAKLAQISPREIDAVVVMDRAVGGDPVDPRHSVFGDVDGQLVSLVDEPWTPVERERLDGPGHGGRGVAGRARNFDGRSACTSADR